MKKGMKVFIAIYIIIAALIVVLELCAIFFLVQSLLNVYPEGESNWYLPLALGLNAIALFLSAAQRRKQI